MNFVNKYFIVATIAIYQLIVWSEQSVWSQKGYSQTPQEFVESWAAAISRYDVDELLKFCEQSDTVELRSSSGVRAIGIENVRPLYDADVDKVTFSDSKTVDMKMRILDSIAMSLLSTSFD